MNWRKPDFRILFLVTLCALFVASILTTRSQSMRLEAPKEWPSGSNRPPPRLNPNGLGDFESRLSPASIKAMQKFACQQPQDGQLTTSLRVAVLARLKMMNAKDPKFPDRLTNMDLAIIRRAIRDNRVDC